MSAVDPGVYKAVLSVRRAYPFDVACLLMRIYGYMMNIGTVTMLTLSGYSFFIAGLVSSVIAIMIFVVAPRIGKMVDERGQSKVIPIFVLINMIGLTGMLVTVSIHGPIWMLFASGALMGSLPNSQALARARWTYLLRTKQLGEDAPNIRTVFSYEGILDDLGFMFSPSLSIFLATVITPIAGLFVGGVLFAIGSIILCLAKSSEPVPGWSVPEEGLSENRALEKRASRESEEPLLDASDAGAGKRKTPSHISTYDKDEGIFRKYPVVRVLFALMLFLGSFFGVFDTTVVAFAEDLGDPNIASGVLMLSAVVSIAMGFIFGMVRITSPASKQLIVAACLIGFSYAFMMIVDDVVILYIVSCVASLFYAPFLIVCNSACERAVPGKRLTESITLMNAGCTFGLAVGPTVAGVLLDGFGWHLAFIAGGVLALAIPATALLCRKLIMRDVRSDTYEVIG